MYIFLRVEVYQNTYNKNYQLPSPPQSSASKYQLFLTLWTDFSGFNSKFINNVIIFLLFSDFFQL